MEFRRLIRVLRALVGAPVHELMECILQSEKLSSLVAVFESSHLVELVRSSAGVGDHDLSALWIQLPHGLDHVGPLGMTQPLIHEDDVRSTRDHVLGDLLRDTLAFIRRVRLEVGHELPVDVADELQERLKDVRGAIVDAQDLDRFPRFGQLRFGRRLYDVHVVACHGAPP